MILPMPDDVSTSRCASAAWPSGKIHSMGVRSRPVDPAILTWPEALRTASESSPAPLGTACDNSVTRSPGATWATSSPIAETTPDGSTPGISGSVMPRWP